MTQDGWKRKAALQTCVYYRNFLFLNKKYRQQVHPNILPPSEDVDEFWHYHILDTKKYITDCEMIFGSYFHHYPYLILDHQINKKELNNTFELTQKLHIQEFGEPIYATRHKNWWGKILNFYPHHL